MTGVKLDLTVTYTRKHPKCGREESITGSAQIVKQPSSTEDLELSLKKGDMVECWVINWHTYSEGMIENFKFNENEELLAMACLRRELDKLGGPLEMTFVKPEFQLAS